MMVTTMLFVIVLVLFLWMVRTVIIAAILGIIVALYMRPLYCWLHRRLPKQVDAGGDPHADAADRAVAGVLTRTATRRSPTSPAYIDDASETRSRRGSMRRCTSFPSCRGEHGRGG